MILAEHFPLLLPLLSMVSTTLSPSTTFPNTTCLPSSLFTEKPHLGTNTTKRKYKRANCFTDISHKKRFTKRYQRCRWRTGIRWCSVQRWPWKGFPCLHASGWSSHPQTCCRRWTFHQFRYGWWSRRPAWREHDISVMSTTASDDITGFRAYLAHELRDDAVKARSLVAKTLLAGAQSTEVLCLDRDINV